MWRMMSRLATATLTATLALAAASAPKVDASTIQSTDPTPPPYLYITTGSISGMAGNEPIEFKGTLGALNTTSATSLGEFITNPLPPTATLTYNNTPFVIDLNVVTAPGSPIPTYDYQITGVLNGSISGNGSPSSMFASITSITGNDFGTGATPPFPISSLLINGSLQIAAPDGDTKGVSQLMGVLDASSLPPPVLAPEPASVVMFGTVLAGAWLIQRRRSKLKTVALGSDPI
jgi:hypothetical protein